MVRGLGNQEVGWEVSPEREEFRWKVPQEALVRCLVWLMVEEFSGGSLA